MPGIPDARLLLGTLVAQTARQWRRAVDKELQPYGLTEATWLPLLRLARSSTSMCQKDLAEALSLDSSSMVRLIDNLQTKQLIERREGTDRRTNAIHLTPAGRGMVERVEEIAHQVRERALAELSDKDINKAISVLERICEAFSRMGQETV